MGLNDLVGSLLDLIQNTRDDWDAESSIQQADLNPSAKDTNILLDAITKGSGNSFVCSYRTIQDSLFDYL